MNFPMGNIAVKVPIVNDVLGLGGAIFLRSGWSEIRAGQAFWAVFED